jgi:hypothetical protein
MNNKQFPFRWRSAAFRPLGGYWITRQDGQFPDEPQESIEQMYQKWLLLQVSQNTSYEK